MAETTGSGFNSWALCPRLLGGKSFQKEGTSEAIPSEQGSVGEKRIISLAPSITEILFALGQGEQVVGVTRYCNYPPEAQTRARVGGYFDLNYEAVVSLEPTFVIMLEEHVKAREYFDRIGYEVLILNHQTMEGITDSIEVIGRACGCEPEAAQLTTDIRNQLDEILSPVRGKPVIRTLIAVDRSKPRSLEQIYIAGNDGFFDKMIELAGGINVYKGSVPFPAVSAEGIIQMNPDIIIEVIPETRLKQSTAEELKNDWASLVGVEAVENRRVFLLTNNYVSIPGPRYILTLRDIVSLLHTEPL